MDILVSPQIERLIRDSLDEDIGAGDLATMATISADAQGKGLFRAKKDGVVAGLVLLERIFYFIDPRVQVRLLTKDGIRSRAEPSWRKQSARCGRCFSPSGRPSTLCKDCPDP